MQLIFKKHPDESVKSGFFPATFSLSSKVFLTIISQARLEYEMVDGQQYAAAPSLPWSLFYATSVR